MKFYDNRFDFIRLVNPDKYINFDAETADEKFASYKEAKNYVLPLDKYELNDNEGNPTGTYIGEDNVVEGSTCFFIQTGDLFIAFKNDEGYIAWYQVGITTSDNGIISDESWDTYLFPGDNPYTEDEPI